MSNRVLLPGESIDGNTVLFEIISARTIEKEGEENKHVAYTIRVKHFSGKEDVNPVTIERRYTNFADLYNTLRNSFPDLMLNVVFPKKALIGNFDDKLIANRSTSFDNLLKHIASDSRLMYTEAFVTFLQDIELKQAKSLMDEKRYEEAKPLLENNFRILSKVYTDRSKAVLLALCRLLGCCSIIPGVPDAETWAELALHRYEGVCDSDLLSLYVPILQLCIKLKSDDTAELEKRLEDLRRHGMRVTDVPSLLEAVAALE